MGNRREARFLTRMCCLSKRIFCHLRRLRPPTPADQLVAISSRWPRQTLRKVQRSRRSGRPMRQAWRCSSSSKPLSTIQTKSTAGGIQIQVSQRSLVHICEPSSSTWEQFSNWRVQPKQLNAMLMSSPYAHGLAKSEERSARTVACSVPLRFAMGLRRDDQVVFLTRLALATNVGETHVETCLLHKRRDSPAKCRNENRSVSDDLGQIEASLRVQGRGR